MTSQFHCFITNRVYVAVCFPQFLQKRKARLLLQIACNQLTRPDWFGLMRLMLEGNVEVIFSILQTGLSWRVEEQPLKSPSHWKMTLTPPQRLQLQQYPFSYLCWSVDLHKFFSPRASLCRSHLLPPIIGLLWQWYLKRTCSNGLNVIRKVLF